MDALLFKSNLREAQFCKDEYKKVKRTENKQRRKQARGISVQDKRKIPENLEFSNDSIHVNKEEDTNKNVTGKYSKPSRLTLLRKWRRNKDLEKKAIGKSRKAPFVVKHVVYSDLNSKGNTKCKKETHATRGKKVLKEQNTNVRDTYRPAQKLLNRPIAEKQSYTEWKKSQVTHSQEKCITNSKLINGTNNKCANQERKEVLKGDRNQVTIKNEKNKPETLMESSVETEKSRSCCGVRNDIDISQSSVENKENHISNDNMNSTEKSEPCNNFTIDSPNIIENIIPKEEPVAFVNSVVCFEPPKGLEHIPFKFNEKSIDIVSDINSMKNVPKQETELFSPNLSQITNDESDESFTTDNITGNDKLKTPVMSFREREGMQAKTPTSTPKRLALFSRKNSLTPNPKNFLRKIEDPVAQQQQQMETPKSLKKQDASLPDSVAESVRHFESLVTAEEEKFLTSLEKWERIQQEDIAPVEYQGNILAAIGQAQLFIRKRFKQFKDLIDLHKDSTAEKAAHASDLDGFWEMIYYQVEDVHKRFAELNRIEQNNWVDDTIRAPTKQLKKVKPKKVEKPNPSKKVTSKRSDFRKFKQQMMAKKQAEQQAFIPETEGFIQIITPLKNKTGEKVMTPVRRSIRNLPDNPKDSSDICLIIPFESLSLKQKSAIKGNRPRSTEKANITESRPEQSKEDVPLDVHVLRRSTRKTPSKYKSIDLTHNKKKVVDHVACSLFESAEDAPKPEDEDFEFSRYLSKSTSGDQQTPVIDANQPVVKRDLLTSFDSPIPKHAPIKFDETDDLMVFASPLPQNNPSSSSSVSSSMQPGVEDLLA